jgi:hypothetical protein
MVVGKSLNVPTRRVGSKRKVETPLAF